MALLFDIKLIMGLLLKTSYIYALELFLFY